MGFWLLAAGVAALVTVTVLPILKLEHWLVRSHDFPRLQYAGAGLSLLLGQYLALDWTLRQSWVLAAVTSACALDEEYPHSVKCSLENLYGMHLYSRFPLEDAAIQYLVEPGIPSIHASIQLPCGREVKLHCLHPGPPSPTENSESTQRDAELVAVAGKVAEAENRTPVIVAGDLNDVAWSATTSLFRKISASSIRGWAGQKEASKDVSKEDVHTPGASR